MNSLVKSNKGFTVAELMVGIFLFAMVAVVTPELFLQFQKSNQKNEFTSELDQNISLLGAGLKGHRGRLKDIMIYNLNQIPNAIQEEINFCFKLSGSTIKGNFCEKYQITNWTSLKDNPNATDKGFMLNQKWGSNGICQDTKCIYESKVAYQTRCASRSCTVVNFNLNLKPTATSLFKARTSQITLPVSYFSDDQNVIESEVCKNGSTLLSGVDLQYQKNFCNDNFSDESTCDISLFELGNSSSCIKSNLLNGLPKLKITSATLIDKKIDTGIKNVQLAVDHTAVLKEYKRPGPGGTEILTRVMLYEPEKGDKIIANCDGAPPISFSKNNLNITLDLSSLHPPAGEILQVHCKTYVQNKFGNSKGLYAAFDIPIRDSNLIVAGGGGGTGSGGGSGGTGSGGGSLPPDGIPPPGNGSL